MIKSKLPVTHNREVKTNDASRQFNEFVRRIEEAAATETPAATMFSATVPKRLTSIFRLGYRFNPPKQVERHLDSLVRQASALIKEVFRQQIGYFTHTSTGKRQSAIYKRAHYDASSRGYFTHMAVPVGLPWETENKEKTVDPMASLQHLDVSQASAQWLQVLCAHHKNEDERAYKQQDEEDTRAYGEALRGDAEESLDFKDDEVSSEGSEGSDEIEE